MEAGGCDWAPFTCSASVPRLKCYSDPPSVFRSTETGGSMACLLIPDGVCLWSTLTTVINIQDDSHCCRRRIDLTTTGELLSYRFCLLPSASNVVQH